MGISVLGFVVVFWFFLPTHFFLHPSAIVAL